MLRRDPLSNPAPLIKRVYAYVAYRIGSGPEAEDVTSDVFERALRYRASYDESKGDAAAWLIGIARRCVDDALRNRREHAYVSVDGAAPGDPSADAVRRLDIAEAVARLEPRDRDLIALRYGADLTARQVAAALGMRTNAVEVALHRARQRLRVELESAGEFLPRESRA